MFAKKKQNKLAHIESQRDWEEEMGAGGGGRGELVFSAEDQS